MKYKTFKYKNYNNCSFYVTNYSRNPDAMFIGILDEKGNRIFDCTRNVPDYFYEENVAVIKNYSETYGMTDFLRKMGIVKQINTKSYFKIFGNSSNESMDYCDIDIDKLKKYSSTFNYKWE